MVNRESINNRFKLAFHRLVARRLKSSPPLLKRARAVVRAWMSYPDAPAYVTAWEHLLSKPVGEICREIVSRSERHELLRNSSPFSRLRPMIMLEEDRRRLWQIVKRPPTTP